MKMMLGNIESHEPLDLAESALIVATLQSGRERAKFALTCGPDRRLFIRRQGREYTYGKKNSGISPAEWIATFTKQADPDWLADEIAGARL